MNDINVSAVEGEYYLLEHDKWFKLEISLNLEKSRVNRLPATLQGHELRIYITEPKNTRNKGIIECGKYLLHNKKTWIEVRKTKGNEKGKPYFITESNFIRFPKICKDKRVIIYVKKR